MSVVCDALPPSAVEFYPLMAEPASGPQRSRTAAMTSDKERRKRSRVTPEQLIHLERFFSMDRSPTAARRKEISELLGMQERQTQIWFQNRRAKAKLQDGKKGQLGGTEIPPEKPPELAAGYEAELHHLLHEDEPVTIIPCTDLSIGTWRRVTTTPRQHDLVAYLCDSKHCLTWFIHSSGYGFKMEIPFDAIVHTEFTNAAPGLGLASFLLSRPPTFYLESHSPPNPGRSTGPVRHWKKCADWTEDQQATKVLRHNLVGSAVQLAHLLRHLNSHMSGSDIQLHSPNHHHQAPSSSVLQTESPALIGFASTGYYQHPHPDLHQPDQSIVHRRSSSLPISEPHLSLPNESTHLSITRPLSSVISEPDPSFYFQHPRHPTLEVGQSASYANYPEISIPRHLSCPSLPDSCGSSRSFSPYPSRQRPYSAGSTHSLGYDDDGKILFSGSFQPTASVASTPFGTPSPPLLSTAFYPPGPAPNTYTVSPYDPTISVVSGIPTGSNPTIHEPTQLS